MLVAGRSPGVYPEEDGASKELAAGCWPESFLDLEPES